MKKLVSCVLTLVVFLGMGTQVNAATTGSIPVSAGVDGSMVATFTMYKEDSNTVITPMAMAFGELGQVSYNDTIDIPDANGNLVPTDVTYQELRSIPDANSVGSTTMGHARIKITVNNHGGGWEVKQTGSALVAGGNTIPTGACVVKAYYVPQDNFNGTGYKATADGTFPQPGGGTWVASDKLLYKNNLGTIDTIQAAYAITGDRDNSGATASVPVSQAGGAYTASVTITVTAI